MVGRLNIKIQDYWLKSTFISTDSVIILKVNGRNAETSWEHLQFKAAFYVLKVKSSFQKRILL